MRILIFQHLDVEHPGVFREFWAERGDVMHAVELDAGEEIPSLERFDLMVVMGGPMDVWQEDAHPWLVPEKAAIRHWVRDLGRPYLGVCLGHQLLGEVLGSEVGLMARPEVGLAKVALSAAGRADPVLAGFGATVETFQWHGAEVKSVPEGAEMLASNAACALQAFRWGRYAYGFQYHVEITESTVGEWERIPAYRASLVTALGAERASRLADELSPRLPAFRAAASRLSDNLAAIVSDAVSVEAKSEP